MDKTKRRNDRLAFSSPLYGRFKSIRVVVNSLSVDGAGIEHHLALPRGEVGPLQFTWGEHAIAVNSRVVHTREERVTRSGGSLTLHRSGVHFLNPTTGAAATARNMISIRLSRALEEQRSNAYAVSRGATHLLPDEVVREELRAGAQVIDLDRFFVPRRPDASGYISCVLENDIWVRRPATELTQPENGFIVSAEEGEAALEMLCATYQDADLHVRQLIRTFAHLSITEVSDVPRNRFNP